MDCEPAPKVTLLLKILAWVDAGKLTLAQWYTLVQQEHLTPDEYAQLMRILQQIAVAQP